MVTGENLIEIFEKIDGKIYSTGHSSVKYYIYSSLKACSSEFSDCSKEMQYKIIDIFTEIYSENSFAKLDSLFEMFCDEIEYIIAELNKDKTEEQLDDFIDGLTYNYRDNYQ